MFKIINRLLLGKDVRRIDIFAPLIARKAKPGQFVVVLPDEQGAGLPLAIVETDPVRGALTLIFRETSATTRRLSEIPINESLHAVVGPLGHPATIKKWGTVLCVASGVGTAQILPVCRALKECGNKVIGVLGAPSRGKLMLEAQVRLACGQVFIATEDGTFERRGRATDVVEDLLSREKFQMVYTVGSVVMMEKVCVLTKKRGVKTLIQVTSGISCGVGLCGACRIQVGSQTVLACQEGPEFDGHKVDFKVLKIREAAQNKEKEKKLVAVNDELNQVIAKFFPGKMGRP